jgi:hypothetical protein
MRTVLAESKERYGRDVNIGGTSQILDSLFCSAKLKE